MKRLRARSVHDVLIELEGFKSIYTKQEMRIKPLTILAGTNSSGKSSFMQPLLLMKQTLEAQFDPGSLLLEGRNARFTDADQVLSNTGKARKRRSFSVSINFPGSYKISLSYEKQKGSGLLPSTQEIVWVTKLDNEKRSVSLSRKVESEDLKRDLSKVIHGLPELFKKQFEKSSVAVRVNRCFLRPSVGVEGPETIWEMMSDLYAPTDRASKFLQSIIHLPGLRGSPERTYSKTATGDNYPGRFDEYVASIIYKWKTERGGRENLNLVGDALVRLGLTWKVDAREVSDAKVELLVGRLPRSTRGGAKDLVSIADVGFGVSQTLPVVVALIVARPGQVVYIEQPEIHLHPRAQLALAQLLAEAVARGVLLVIETHSSMLIRGVQIEIANKRLKHQLVALHWFNRDDTSGETTISSASFDSIGAFGDWPIDFDEVSLSSDSAYMDAVEELIENG